MIKSINKATRAIWRFTKEVIWLIAFVIFTSVVCHFVYKLISGLTNELVGIISSAVLAFGMIVSAIATAATNE